MKKVLMFILVIIGLIAAGGLALALLTPWMERWGATDAEIGAAFPGDAMVPEPARIINRAVTIHATPEQIYPWIAQIGAGRGGWYSYEWLETNLLRCPIVNADGIHPEWQDLKVGDLVKMCPDEFGPPPYTVAQIEPGQAVLLGHQGNGQWVDLWQFVILPQPDGTSRLVSRTRTMMAGGIWSIIEPGVFIMERGMLLGIKQRAEALGSGTLAGNLSSPTPTPEVFQPVDPSPTPAGSDLPITCQITDLNVYIDRGLGYCFAYPSRFTLGDQPSDHPPVLGPALGSPAEPVNATFIVERALFVEGKSLEAQADEFLMEFSVMDPASYTRQPVTVGGETGILVEPVPVQLSWRILFVRHGEFLFRLMYWPVDVPEAKADLDELYQVTLNTFAFVE